MSLNKTTSLIISLVSFFLFNSCDKEDVESDSTGEGYIQLNDLKIAIDFVSINGPYLTIGCGNSVKLELWYGNTVENLDQVFIPETPETPREGGYPVEGTLSSVGITIDNNPFCGGYSRNILEGSYFNAKNLGGGKYGFESLIKLNHCKKIDLKIEYTGTIYFESEDCYGCARPCTTKDNSFLSNEPSNQVLKIKRPDNVETTYTYNDDDKIAYISSPMTGSLFSYENGQLSSYTFRISEITEYDIQNEDGKIKRIYKSEFNSTKHDVNYFIYQNGIIVQSIDSLYESDEGQLLGTTEFEYDENENLIKEIIIRDGEMVQNIQYEYDDKVNPFYQMYHSWNEDFSPITSPNNAVRIIYNDIRVSNKIYNIEFKFEYDSRGYPVRIGDSSIEYYRF